MIHNIVGVSVGQKKTVGREVPDMQPWWAHSATLRSPGKSRNAQTAISPKQKGTDRIRSWEASLAKHTILAVGLDLEEFKSMYRHLPHRNQLHAGQE